MAKIVEIVGCRVDTYWYADRIGDRFNVFGERGQQFKVDGLKEPNVWGYIVDKADCKIIEDNEKEENVMAEKGTEPSYSTGKYSWGVSIKPVPTKRRIKILVPREQLEDCIFVNDVDILHMEWNWDYDGKMFWVAHPELEEACVDYSCPCYFFNDAKLKCPFLFEENKQIMASTEFIGGTVKSIEWLRTIKDPENKDKPWNEPVVGVRKGYEDTGPIPGISC